MVKYSRNLDRVFQALGSTPRRQLLERISREDARVQELASPLRMSLPAVSKHLKILESAGLILRHKEGRCYFFSVNLKAALEAEKWIEQYTKIWNDRLDSLEKYLLTLPPSHHGKK